MILLASMKNTVHGFILANVSATDFKTIAFNVQLIMLYQLVTSNAFVAIESVYTTEETNFKYQIFRNI
jgi:hypothetical protein